VELQVALKALSFSHGSRGENGHGDGHKYAPDHETIFNAMYLAIQTVKLANGGRCTTPSPVRSTTGSWEEFKWEDQSQSAPCKLTDLQAGRAMNFFWDAMAVRLYADWSKEFCIATCACDCALELRQGAAHVYTAWRTDPRQLRRYNPSSPSHQEPLSDSVDSRTMHAQARWWSGHPTKSSHAE
jgi:hypothetical protein